MSYAQTSNLLSRWVPSMDKMTESQQVTLNEIYGLMIDARFSDAEKQLAELYVEAPQVLPQWLTLLTEQQQYAKIRALVAKGIISPSHSSAVIAQLYANNPLPQLRFTESQGTLPLQSHWVVDLPRIKVQLNGHSFYFVLDTGASQSLVTDKVVNKLQLSVEPSRKVKIDTATVNTVTADLVRLPSFQLGPITADNQLALVVDHEQLEQRFLGINWYQIDGILGWPIIKALNLTIDFEEQVVEIKRPNDSQKTRGNLVWLFDDPMVISNLNDNPRLWFLDTGAMESQLTNDYLTADEHQEISWKHKKFNGLGGKGEGEQSAKFGPIRITFPSLTKHFKKLTVRAGNQDCSFSRCDGRLGVDTAENLRMHINFHAGSFDISNKY